MRVLTLLTSVVLPLVVAQSNNDLGLGLKAIQAHFNQSYIVPDLLATFQPKALLNINYGAGNIQPGQAFTKEQVSLAPVLSIQSSGPLSGSYLLAMMDADIPHAKLPQGPNRHWLLSGVTIGQDSVVNNATATVISRYWGPWPAAGSGPHRYVILLYSQTSDFTLPAEFNQTDMPVAPMDWNAFVTNSHLGDILAANYIQVEEGTASTSIVSTAPVVTSTLVVSTASASASPSSSATPNNTKDSGGVLGLKASISFVLGATCLATLSLV